ncbi:MEX-3 protein [Aphelenchoides avenae]|nr:MEX-3 protein [Aphelenchus avenae]
MFMLRSGKQFFYASRAMTPHRSAPLVRAQFAVTRRSMELDSVSVQASSSELPSGHVIKFVKVDPSLKHLVVGPKGETLQKLQENTYTSVTEKRDGFEATGIPTDIERFEAGVHQLLGGPVPMEWVREYEDLVDANVLCLPKHWTRKDSEVARSAQSSGPANRYFFLKKTKALCDLLSNAGKLDILQKETNAEVTYETREEVIRVQMNGQEADVRNAFRKLLTTVRDCAPHSATPRALEPENASVQATDNELPCGHIVKFVKVHPSLKHLVKGPHGETLKKLREDTYTSIREKFDGFEVTGIPYDIANFEAEVLQRLGEPVPVKWMRAYQDLVDANVLSRPKYGTSKNKEDAASVQSSGPVNRYFFLAKTKAMWDLLNKVILVDTLQKETNAKVTYEVKQQQILVRMNGQEEDVRNAFGKLLATVQTYAQYAAVQLKALKNKMHQAGVHVGYWRAKLELLDGTCADRSATESKIERVERSMKDLEAKAQRLQLDQGLSEQSVPETALMRELYDPTIETTKAQLREMEAKVEESKKRYEEASKTANGDPENNAKAGHEDLPSSTGLTTVRDSNRTDDLGGKIVKFVKVPPSLKQLVTGPQGETLQKLQEDTHTSIMEKSDGFEATGFPHDIERFETEIQQFLGEPMPMEWMREYEDLMNSGVRLRPNHGPITHKEDAASVQSSGPVNRYFFLAKTKAMWDLLNKVIQTDTLQKETNADVKCEMKKSTIIVRMKGQEEDVRNANSVDLLSNQCQLAGVQIGYWRAKLELLQDTCVDRSATESKIESIEWNKKNLEAKAQRLQLNQGLSEQIPETIELRDPKFNKVKAQLRSMEAKAEEAKKRYEQAMNTASGDSESNPSPGHEDLPSSTSLTTVRESTQYAAIQLAVLNNQIEQARVQTGYWRAHLELLDGTCADRSATESKIESIEGNMKNLEAKAHRLQRKLSKQSMPEAALMRELYDPKIHEAKAQLRVLEAKAEEAKTQYDAREKAKSDAESNARPGQDDLPSSTDSTPEELPLKIEKIRLALAQVQTAHAGHHIDFWRAKTTSLRTGDNAELRAMLANSVKKMNVLVEESLQIEDKLNRTKHLLPQDAHCNDDGTVLALREKVIETQLRANALIEKALVWQLRYNDARMQKLAQEEKGQS